MPDRSIDGGRSGVSCRCGCAARRGRKVGNDYGEGFIESEWKWNQKRIREYYEPGRFVTIIRAVGTDEIVLVEVVKLDLGAKQFERLGVMQPHSDDIPLLYGGTVVKLVKEGYTGILIRTSNSEMDGISPIELRARLIFIFRLMKVDTVISYDPWGHYEEDPDHYVIARAVEAACWRTKASSRRAMLGESGADFSLCAACKTACPTVARP